MTTPKRKPTERQLAALAKAREALLKKHTCERCGDIDPARGLLRHSQDRIYTTLHDGVMHRTCISCRIYYQWLDTQQRIELLLHTLFAERIKFNVIDTETTGKLRVAELPDRRDRHHRPGRKDRVSLALQARYPHASLCQW